MKLDRLTSTTQHCSPESGERTRQLAEVPILPVGAMTGIDGDRLRSLQQELADFDQNAVGPFAGSELIMAAAHDVASQLSALGQTATSRLVKTPDLRLIQTSVDAKA